MEAFKLVIHNVRMYNVEPRCCYVQFPDPLLAIDIEYCFFTAFI